MPLSLGLRSCRTGLVLAALGMAPGAAAQPTLVGSEFQVNSYTTEVQFSSFVAADADGDFIVVWQSRGSSGSDTSQDSIQAQRYASSGSAIGSQFQVNTYTTDFQRRPSVAADADGNFVVVWESYGSSGSDSSAYSIQAQRYASSGNAIGSQFQVNTDTTYGQTYSSVAADADGDFVIVWETYGFLGAESIQAQRYASSGNVIGSEFQVDTYFTFIQGDPSVAADADGDFVVVWESYGSPGGDTSGHSVQGQRYDSAGNAVGSQFQVNTYTTLNQLHASVTATTDGAFVVVWESNGSSGGDTSSASIQGQRYDSAGSPLGGEFQVNTYTAYSQARPSVAAEVDGDFVVAWESYGSSGGDTSYTSVQGQRYDSVGNPLGGEFQVNTYTTFTQSRPSVAAEAGGGFVVVWQSWGSSGSDTSTSSIQGQRYTTALKVPSLSPAALAAAALLVCLAALVALHRRV